MLKGHNLTKLLSQWLWAFVSKVLRMKFLSHRMVSFIKEFYYKELKKGKKKKQSIWKWEPVPGNGVPSSC